MNFTVVKKQVWVSAFAASSAGVFGEGDALTIRHLCFTNSNVLYSFIVFQLHLSVVRDLN